MYLLLKANSTFDREYVDYSPPSLNLLDGGALNLICFQFFSTCPNIYYTAKRAWQQQHRIALDELWNLWCTDA